MLNGEERLGFQGTFGKVDFKTHAKSDDAVLVVVSFERGGPSNEMKQFEADLQPVINNSIEGFYLLGEEKFRKNELTGVKEPYNDEIYVNEHFAFEKCATELEQGGFTTLKITFSRFWPIEALDGIPQALLKFRGQKCDVRLAYTVRQQELALDFTVQVVHEDTDPLFDECVRVAMEMGFASVSIFVTTLGITEDRARKLVGVLINTGILADDCGDTPTTIMKAALAHLNREKVEEKATEPAAEGDEEKPTEGADKTPGEKDPLFVEAVRLIVPNGTASTSSIQRAFGIGYNRAFAIMQALEKAGLIGPHEGPNKGRKVLDAAREYVAKIDGETAKGVH